MSSVTEIVLAQMVLGSLGSQFYRFHPGVVFQYWVRARSMTVEKEALFERLVHGGLKLAFVLERALTSSRSQRGRRLLIRQPGRTLPQAVTLVHQTPHCRMSLEIFILLDHSTSLKAFSYRQPTMV